MTEFKDLGLSEAALAAVERLGYDAPTPVQEQSIPLILEGRDVIAAASTGTGKTAAFLLPTLSTLERTRGKGRAPRVCVVSPTRELASQIARTCMQIARKTGHFVTTVFGGTPYGPQIRELRGGTDVLIATPGRLNDLMDRGVVDLGEVQVLVLDEADRMLDMGFLPDVTTIVDATPDDRQTLLFSATIDRSIEKNLKSLLKDPAIVEIARNGETAATVEQYIMPIPNRQKPELLRAVLDEKGHERVIVFARTKNRVEDCAEQLLFDGYRAESIHSDKTQARRRRALENFRRGKTDILVATDVLARGIDVPDVDYVINYDLPDMSEDYIHRIGRTGRAGEKGFAISFVTPEGVRTLRDIEKLIGKDLPFMQLEDFETDPSILEKKGKKRGGSGRNRGDRPSGARRSGEKRAERFEREGRRPRNDDRDDRGYRSERRDDRGYRGDRSRDERPRDRYRDERARRDDRGYRDDRKRDYRSRDERGYRGERDGERRYDRRDGEHDRYRDRDERGYRGERDYRDRDERGYRGGRDHRGGRSYDDRGRSRNAKNAQSRINRKARRDAAPKKPSSKKNRGGQGGGYDYSRFAK